MTFAGNDPSGGAGLAADIETLTSLGCHPAPVITALTVHDTHTVHALSPIAPEHILDQAHAVLADMPVAVFKMGVIGSVENVAALQELLADYPNIPIVLDPVLAAGGGTELASAALIDALRETLLPLTTVLTPNSIEARRLVPEAETLHDCAMELLARGCRSVLLTGGHESGAEVINTLYGDQKLIETWHWPRLPYEYHGSGCTLAAAIAAFIAQGYTVQSACYNAQAYTWRALQAAYRAGGGQWIPHRSFAHKNNPTD